MNTTSVSDSLTERIESSAQVLGKPSEQVIQELTLILGPNLDEWSELLSSEEFTKFGDFMKAFKDDSKDPSPIAIVRKAVRILRGSSQDTKAEDPRGKQLKEVLGVKPTMDSANTIDLLSLYLVDKPEDPVTRELKKRYEDLPIIAFVPGTTQVAVSETISYVTDQMQGMPSQESIMVEGSLSRLFPVGLKPIGTIAEDPLYPNSPLSADGRSVKNYINWSDVELETRKFVRIILERGEIKTEDRMRMIEIVKKAVEGTEALAKIFPEAELDFRERKEEGTLPNLKVRITGQTGNNPFSGLNKTW